MNYRRSLPAALALAALSTFAATAAGTLQTPEQFLGFASAPTTSWPGGTRSSTT